MSSAATRIELPHSRLLQTQSTLHFPISILCLSFYYFTSFSIFSNNNSAPIFLFMLFSSSFHIPLQSSTLSSSSTVLGALDFKLWSGCVNPEAFHDFSNCPGEFQDSTLKYAVTISCSFYIFISLNTT